MQNIDAVAVLTPPHAQMEIALAALAAGKHVLVERPVTRTLDEAEKLAAAHRASNPPKAVMAGYHLRFHRHIQRARRLIAAGSLGRIRLFHSIFSTTNDRGRHYAEYRKHRHLGGGALTDLAVAHFDLWRYLLDDEVVEVCAVSEKAEADDVAAGVVGRMKSGIVATSTFGEDAAEQHQIAIHGTQAKLEMSLYRVDGFLLSRSGTFPGDPGSRIARVTSALKHVPEMLRTSRAGGIYLDSYEQQWRHFIESVLLRRAPSPSLHDSRCALGVAVAAVESADSGRTVRVTS
jgi:myo-inositol 2-dehydrogenase/D-chiro-inositol 1-dehydrogenase